MQNSTAKTLPPAAEYRGAARIGALAESATLALAKKVREMNAAGKNVLSLTLGEPDFDTPDFIREAAIVAIREGDTHYPPVAGTAALREACAAKFRANGIASEAANIVVSTGAKQSILNLLMALIEPGDEVILLAPYWVSYNPMVRMAEGVPVIVDCKAENGLKTTPAQLEAAITPRTRALLFNSPSNPHGAVYSEAEVRALAAVLERHPQVFVISDEIYEHMNYTGQPHFSIGAVPSMKDRVATVNGMSKGYAMTGWRLGYCTAPLWLAQAAEKYQGQVTSGASSISQRAALAALTGDLAPTQAMVAEFHRRRDLLCTLIREQIPQWQFDVPPGAFYLYPDVSADFGKTSPDGKRLATCDDIAMYLLETGRVSVVPGSAFGTDAHVRLSYASSEKDLREAVRRMAEALKQLK